MLAVIAAHAPAVASRDLIGDALWGESPPASAANAIQVYISGLRKAAATAGYPDAFVISERGGYRLGLEVLVDAHLLRQLVNGTSVTRTQTSQQRIAQWEDARTVVRGVVLQDLEDSAGLHTHRAELEALVEHARRLRYEELLRVGRSADVVRELTPIVVGDPGHEGHADLLARAQYLVGHQVDALHTLTAHRRAMAETFGLDPSTAIVRLERQILTQDPALNVPVPADLRVADTVQSTDKGWPVGREDLLEAVLHDLATGAPLVTLVGPGGIGKSAAATAAGRMIQESDAPRSVVVIEAASWPPDSSLLDAVAQAFNPPDGREPYAYAVSMIRQSQTLLILDNLEHLTQAPADVARLTTDLDTGILATARRPLGLASERVLRVTALGQDPGGPGVEVFLRAAARAGHTQPTPELVELALEVVAHAGGVPLGIELVASWLRVLDSQSLRHRLGLSLYETRERQVPVRHRSLAALIDEGLLIVAPAARGLFERLSLCPAGARLPVVEALANDVQQGHDHPPIPVQQLILDLVDAGLLQPVLDPDGAFRYRMFPPVREHAESLFIAGDVSRSDEARLAWSHATAHMVIEIGNSVRGAEGLSARRVLRAELPQIRTAATWLAEHDMTEVAMDMLGKLRNYAELESRTQELCNLIVETLDRGGDVPPLVKARALNDLALLYPRLNRPDEALGAAREALDIATVQGDELRMGRLHTTISGLLVDQKRLDEAVEHLEAAEELRAAEGDAIGVAVVRNHRGLALLVEGRHSAAVEAFQSVLDVPGIEAFKDATLTARYNVCLTLAITGDPTVSDLLIDVLDDTIAIDEHELTAYIAVAAAVAAGASRPAVSAELAGLAMTALRRMDEELEGVEADALHTTIEGSRRTIGDAAFTRAFAVGAAVKEAAVGPHLRSLLADLR